MPMSEYTCPLCNEKLDMDDKLLSALSVVNQLQSPNFFRAEMRTRCSNCKAILSFDGRTKTFKQKWTFFSCWSISRKNFGLRTIIIILFLAMLLAWILVELSSRGMI